MTEAPLRILLGYILMECGGKYNLIEGLQLA
jgi:hypothetical protein